MAAALPAGHKKSDVPFEDPALGGDSDESWFVLGSQSVGDFHNSEEEH